MMKEQLRKIENEPGFLAALDQSGGSTPKALRLYGIEEGAWGNDDEMFSIVHDMRTRIITSPAFGGDRILGAILFENTMDRAISGRPTARYLWEEKRIVPFLKVDKGLAAEENGVQLMKPMPGLESLLDRALDNGVFGTKMRSVVKLADPDGIEEVVVQQFSIARLILEAGLVPIIEPEVDIHSPAKAAAEALLRASLIAHLGNLGDGERVLFKLTLPEEDNFYEALVNHSGVLKVVALSGGYTREEANARMARNHGVVASFSRALTEGLHVSQRKTEFDALLGSSIESIFQASGT